MIAKGQVRVEANRLLRWCLARAPWMVGLVAVALYLNTLAGGFVFDDRYLIERDRQ